MNDVAELSEALTRLRASGPLPADDGDRPARDSSHLRQTWCNVAVTEGRLTAHGLSDREGFECILRAWCQIQPGIRGDSVGFLCWLWDQAYEREDRQCNAAEFHVERAIWPLFDKRAPKAAIQAAAERANENFLFPKELHAVIDAVCRRATRPHRRRRA